jgi:hypothetical protein
MGQALSKTLIEMSMDDDDDDDDRYNFPCKFSFKTFFWHYRI